LAKHLATGRKLEYEIVPGHWLPGRSAQLSEIADDTRQAGYGVPEAIALIAAAQRRRMAAGGTLNMRDVGGYPAAGGGTVRWRTLLRSDALHRLDPEGQAMLAGVGLRSVVDLRTPMEAEAAPSALDGLGLVGSTRRVSLLGDDPQTLPLEPPVELSDIYRYLIVHRGDEIGKAVKALCAEAALPALVHCSAGKDRTGIVIALTLSAVGVPDEYIAADYALSGSYLDPETTQAIGQIGESTQLGDRLTAALLASPPELILNVLHWARSDGGSVAGYLAEHGVTAADLTVLRAALVEAA
jgi:protein-tyrosine phosphatase